MIAQADSIRERDTNAVSQRRCTQLIRNLTLLQVLGGYRFGVRLDELRRAFCEITGEDWCARTFRRDLSALEEIGLAEAFFDENGVTKFRTARTPAEIVAEAVSWRRRSQLIEGRP